MPPMSPIVTTRETLTPAFDAHVHVWERRWQNFIVGTGRGGRFDQRNLLLGLMDRHGVRRACLIAANDELNPDNNEFVAGLCRKNPDRFVMLAEIPVCSKKREYLLEKTLRAWPAFGFRYMAQSGENPRDWMEPECDSFWKRTNAENLLVALSLTSAQAARLGPLIERYPNVRWLLDHMARPRFDMTSKEYRGVLRLARYPSVFVKLSGFYAFTARSSEYPYLDVARFIRSLRDAFGSERLLWGSDAPPVLDFSSYEQSFACLLREEMGLSFDDLTWVFGKTAEHLFRAPPPNRIAAPPRFPSHD
jgi:L-fuconolactonase